MPREKIEEAVKACPTAAISFDPEA
jgi:ferredoxin